MSEAATETPIVNLSEANATDAFTTAASRWGFVKSGEHGSPITLINEVWKQIHAFLGLPRDQRRKLLRSKATAMG